MLTCTVDRESVCMGDDVDCHQRTLQIQTTTDTLIFTQEILKNFHVPKMENCIWGVWLNDTCVAKFDCNTNIIYPFKNKLVFLTQIKVYFSYHYPNGRPLIVKS